MLQEVGETVRTEGKRLQGLSTVGWLERLLECPAMSETREELEGVEDVAFTGGVASEEDTQGLKLQADVDQGFVAFDL